MTRSWQRNDTTPYKCKESRRRRRYVRFVFDGGNVNNWWWKNKSHPTKQTVRSSKKTRQRTVYSVGKVYDTRPVSHKIYHEPIPPKETIRSSKQSMTQGAFFFAVRCVTRNSTHTCRLCIRTEPGGTRSTRYVFIVPKPLLVQETKKTKKKVTRWLHAATRYYVVTTNKSQTV